MTSQKQLDANRKNALQSTGPKSAQGKAVVARNAVTHGLLANLEVLPGLERQQDWEDHQSQILADFAPEGRLELILAERVALLLWRLGRTARYEREVAAIALENAERDLAREDLLWGLERSRTESPLKDAQYQQICCEELLDFLRALPESHDQDPLTSGFWHLIVEAASKAAGVKLIHGIDPATAALWARGYMAKTVGDIRQWVADVAKVRDMKAEALSDGIFGVACRDLAKAKQERKRLTRVLAQYQRARLIPADAELQKIQRYEAHLERSLYKALHELQRMQAVRQGQLVPPPIALDVDVTTQAQGQ